MRWAGKVGTSIDYLIGAYYFDEHIKGSAQFNQLTLTPFQDFRTGTNSKAVFGKVTVHPDREAKPDRRRALYGRSQGL